IDDKTYTESEIRALIYDTNALTRKKAYEQMYSVVESNKHVLFELYKQTVLSWKATGQDIRGHPSALHTRTFSQDIDESLIHTMLSVCQEKKDIFHAYFKKKAELLGTPTLSRFDMYAPLFADKQEINYQQACEMVTQSYTQFSPEFGKIVKDIIQAHHIDVYPQAYKRGGAFCYYTPQNVLPYILLNYTNTIRDVTTLAHELGHAIHDVLCNKQSILVAHPPISLAETASIFGEELMFDRLLSDTPHTQALLASYIDDAYASIIRQAYFVLFEIKAHQAIAQGATLTQVSDIYYALLQEQYGEHVHIPKQFAYEFLMIPHIYHTPFYCFGYSFGNLLTLALYEQYKEQPDGFVQKYTTLLSSGGSASPQTITQQAGFDITQRAFWQKAFVLLEQRINMFLQSQ
ncbi:MAG: M3 family metallopeptidase, partial [Candidatus Woesearchaeota archaeon]